MKNDPVWWYNIPDRSTCIPMRKFQADSLETLAFKSHLIPTRKPLKVNFCLSKVNVGPTIDDLKLDSKAINVHFIAKRYNLVANKNRGCERVNVLQLAIHFKFQTTQHLLFFRISPIVIYYLSTVYIFFFFFFALVEWQWLTQNTPAHKKPPKMCASFLYILSLGWSQV